jgi:hypothetical protein
LQVLLVRLLFGWLLSQKREMTGRKTNIEIILEVLISSKFRFLICVYLPVGGLMIIHLRYVDSCSAKIKGIE